jgi:hypothetical protein
MDAWGNGTGGGKSLVYLGSEVLPLRHSRFASENSREIKSLIGLHFGSTADATPQAVPIERGRERRSLSEAAVPNATQPVPTMLILSSEVPDAVVRRAS